MPQPTLSLFGPLQITLDGQPFASPLWLKTQALLAFLLIEPGIPHRRETLAGLFWPDCPETAARSSLRQALHQLRAVLGAHNPSLVITAQTVQWNLDGAFVDLHEFSSLVDRCARHAHRAVNECGECATRLARAAALYQADLLAGFGLKDCSAFDEWLVVKRQAYRQAALSALDKLAGYYAFSADYERMEQVARRQVEVDPLVEAAHRQVMLALARGQRRNAALLHYEALCGMLKTELGIAPEPATVALCEQIAAGQFPKAADSEKVQSAWLRLETTLPFRQSFVSRHKELDRLERDYDQASAGGGRVLLVTGEAGWGKTALINEFVRRILEKNPSAVAAGGSGVAYTGIGDPYHLFSEILAELTGEVAEQVSASGMSPEQARRLQRLVPFTCQAILEQGPDLVGSLLPGESLARRAADYAAAQERGCPGWQASLTELVERKAVSYTSGEVPQQAHLFQQVIRVLKALAQRQPLVLILDDLQWADEGSISLLFQLGRQLTGSRVLLIGAYRPSEIFTGSSRGLTLGRGNGEHMDAAGQPRHPLEAVLHEFRRIWGEIEISLDQEGDRAFIDALLDTEPNRLGPDFRETLYRQTHACPLFTVELLRGMQERGDLERDDAGCWVAGPHLDWDTLPARVEAVIAERIRRIPERLVEIVKTASAEGEIFTAEVVAHVLQAEPYQIVRCLGGDLSQHHRLLHSRGARELDGHVLSQYQFRHILFQRYLYQSLDPAERVHLHAKIAAALETVYAASLDEVVVQLAWHYRQAMRTEKAVQYLQRAGEKAARVAAHTEAIAHFRQALDLLAALPETEERAQTELALCVNLANSFQSARGYGDEEVGRFFHRAQELCRQIGETPQTFIIQWQVARFMAMKSDWKTPLVIMTDLIGQGERMNDPLLVAMGHWGLGWLKVFTGDFGASFEHLRVIIEAYNPEQLSDLAKTVSEDPGVTSRAVAAVALLMQGYPEQGLRMCEEAIALAEKQDQPISKALALAYGNLYGVYSRNRVVAKNMSDACIRLASKHGFAYWRAAGVITQSWSLIDSGQVEPGIEMLRLGIDHYTATGTQAITIHAHVILAAAYGQTSRVEEGLSILEETLERVNRSGEHYYTVEIHRVMGDLLRMQPGKHALAEAAYRSAIEIAQAQGARLWELRATTSLCRLWAAQGDSEKILQGRQVLRDRYAWFTEGFALPDLQEARQLLEQMEG